jgi:LAO/AO transport system kinase
VIPDRPEELLEGIAARRSRALGRGISRLERGGPEAAELVRRLTPETGGARVVGLTGPPGSGKSTLVEALARHARARGETVAVLAIDPTSPFSGGALLGDRVRMQSLYTDPDVFIRSMATRGALGGLAVAAHDAVDLLDAAGFDLILVETVGVGQDEVDVVASVDTVVVVVIPGMGDEIQAAKAGVLEIADVFAVNKADRDGAQRVVSDLHLMLHLGEPEEGADGDHERWTPPVLRTVASTGDGVPELAEALARHRRHLEETGEIDERRRRRLARRMEEIVRARLLERARSGGFDEAVASAHAAGLDPYTAADNLLENDP